MNPIKTGQFIQLLRKERKLTQSELADILMITNKAVSRWETGDGFPDVVILPKLSEALGVSVDEILQGERHYKESTKAELHHLRLKNAYLISVVVMALSFVLFLGLTYGTFKIWIAFIGYVIPASLGLLWLMIERNQFRVISVYDDQDQGVLFETLFKGVSVYVVGFFMTLPQVIYAIDGAWPNSVITFEYYIFTALAFGVLGFTFVLSGFVYFYEKGKYLKHHRPVTNKILIYVAIIFVLSVFSISINIFLSFMGLQGLLLFLGVGIYYLIKKQDSIYMFLLRIWVSVGLVLGLNAYRISEQYPTIFLIIFFLAVATILVSWVLWFKTKAYNSLFIYAYQSTFLLVFVIFSHRYVLALAITMSTLILFEMIVVEKVKKKKPQIEQ